MVAAHMHTAAAVDEEAVAAPVLATHTDPTAVEAQEAVADAELP